MFDWFTGGKKDLPTPEEMAEEIVRKEGGLADHKEDLGGLTNFGISLRYARNKGLDLDGDGDVDSDDIHLVTPKKAVKLYLEDFLRAPRLHRAPVQLQPLLFDMSVNHGPGNAVRIFQEMLNDCYGADLKEDGAWGPNTRRAAESAVQQFGWESVNNDLVKARLQFYKDIVRRRPNQKKFIRGWNKRAKSFRV